MFYDKIQALFIHVFICLFICSCAQTRTRIVLASAEGIILSLAGKKEANVRYPVEYFDTMLIPEQVSEFVQNNFSWFFSIFLRSMFQSSIE